MRADDTMMMEKFSSHCQFCVFKNVQLITTRESSVFIRVPSWQRQTTAPRRVSEWVDHFIATARGWSRKQRKDGRNRSTAAAVPSRSCSANKLPTINTRKRVLCILHTYQAIVHGSGALLPVLPLKSNYTIVCLAFWQFHPWWCRYNNWIPTWAHKHAPMAITFHYMAGYAACESDGNYKALSVAGKIANFIHDLIKNFEH